MMKLSSFIFFALLLMGCNDSSKESVQSGPQVDVVDAVAHKLTSSENALVLRIEEMDCGSCAKKIKKALYQFPGVKGVQTYTKTRMVVIEISDKELFDFEKVTAQIKDKAGYSSVKQ